MGTFNIYKCSNCCSTIRLGGPQEFSKTLFGIKEVKHAGNNKRNISGLLGYFWCPACNEERREKTVEFRRKCTSGEVWSNSAPVKRNHQSPFGDTYCSVCRNEVVSEIEENKSCPFCSFGILEFQNTINT